MKTALALTFASILGLSACDKPSASPAAAAGSATTSAALAAPGPHDPGSPNGNADPLVGRPAPDFSATAQDGTTVRLASLKGKQVVLYFYPEDETPGCTKEACSFRDSWDAIGKTGAVLIGISADTQESHKAFVSHYGLPFLLVSDADGTIAKSFGVPFAGHHDRQTVVIGADGNVKKVYRKVNVATHASQIVHDLST
jgi:peroxiredoxin Q/BCP